MTLEEAKKKATSIRAAGKGLLSAKPVRILASDVDPIVPGDNGWDVEVIVHEEDA